MKLSLSKVQRRVLEALLPDGAHIVVWNPPAAPYIYTGKETENCHRATLKNLRRRQLVASPDAWGWDTMRRYFITPAGIEALG